MLMCFLFACFLILNSLLFVALFVIKDVKEAATPRRESFASVRERIMSRVSKEHLKKQQQKYAQQSQQQTAARETPIGHVKLEKKEHA